jgi:GTP1/OBG/50S ribosome-binding GTPase
MIRKLVVVLVYALSMDANAFGVLRNNNNHKSPVSLCHSIGSEQHEETETFYSPNVEIDDSKYRYDLESDGLDSDSSSHNDDDNDNDNQSSVNEYSFFDEATIYVRAGSGGQGASTYKKGVGGQDGPPDGGNGGRGGDVIMVVDDSLNTLAGLTQAWRPNSFGGSGASYKNQDAIARPKSFRAETGCDGDRRVKNGRWGLDVVIRVPPGTVVQEEIETKDEQGEIIAVTYIDIGALTMDEPQLVVAMGGEGGEGSGVAGKFAGRGVRRPRIPPVRGERKKLKLTLKIVADVALVGVPNAGKSTFLASVTRAKPKIANVSDNWVTGMTLTIIVLLTNYIVSIHNRDTESRSLDSARKYLWRQIHQRIRSKDIRGSGKHRPRTL